MNEDIVVYFKNNARFAFNLILDKLVGTNDAATQRLLTNPGDTQIYRWHAQPDSSPSNADVNSVSIRFLYAYLDQTLTKKDTVDIFFYFTTKYRYFFWINWSRTNYKAGRA